MEKKHSASPWRMSPGNLLSLPTGPSALSTSPKGTWRRPARCSNGHWPSFEPWHLQLARSHRWGPGGGVRTYRQVCRWPRTPSARGDEAAALYELGAIQTHVSTPDVAQAERLLGGDAVSCSS